MVRHLPCGPFVNASERLAVERLKAKLTGTDGLWLLLSNLDHAAHPGGRADEIDLIVIGPPGVAVIEVKHWDADAPRKQGELVEQEAGRINAKAKRIAGRLRARLDPGFVPARLLLTRGEVRFKTDRRPEPRGVPVFGLPEWRQLLDLDGPPRLDYAQAAAAALGQFHTPDQADSPPTLHRQLSPQSLRVRHNNQPLFTGLDLTRIAEATTVAAARPDLGDLTPWCAPEVQQGGLAAADTRSDLYALCASLRTLFGGDDPQARRIDQALAAACVADPTARPTLPALAATLADLAEPAPTGTNPVEPPAPTLPAAAYWDEDTVVPFKEARYKVLGRLGAGGVGLTFKVVEIGAGDEERFGTYVAKVVNNEADGATAIAAYRRARAWTTHPHLSPIHEYAAAWEPEGFVALLKWIEGVPLEDYRGVLSILAEDLDEVTDGADAETLALRWAGQLCQALATLHRQGLIDGDVSPRNIIVSGGDMVLTDYDTVVRAGEAPRGGTLPYSSPAVQARQPIAPADDLHALAASLFAVNNGKLLEWVETRATPTWLTAQLRAVLLSDAPPPAPWLRLIDLNRRSLVGGLDGDGLRVDFLDELLDRLLGNRPGPGGAGPTGTGDPWQPCATCTAQHRCTAWQSVRLLREPATGPGLRGRLADLLQACHQRGEVHITARELRAALAYSLFGRRRPRAPAHPSAPHLPLCRGWRGDAGAGAGTVSSVAGTEGRRPTLRRR